MSQRHAVTRRSVLLAGLATPLAAIVGRPAIAQVPAARFRAIAVDLTPLDRYGGGSAGRFLEGPLLSAMRTVFADRLDAGGGASPLLTARITEVFMASYDGAQTFDSLGGNDNIEGDGIVSQAGTVLSSTHILTELPPSYSGSLVTPNLDAIRYQSIAHQFAYWLRREMGI